MTYLSTFALNHNPNGFDIFKHMRLDDFDANPGGTEMVYYQIGNRLRESLKQLESMFA